MRLLLIRHGETPHNVAGALDTAYPGAGLTRLGRAQAEALPAALSDHTISGVYASRLLRAQLTAAPLASVRGLGIEVRPGLEEVSAGNLELRTDEDAVQRYTACVAGWLRGHLEHRLPGGSTGHEFLARYDAALRAIAARHGRDDTVAVFSHGAAIRVYAALAAQLHPEVSTQLRIMNTGMGLLEGDPESGWVLTEWASEPLGGLQLEGLRSHDVTGESAEEALHEQ